MKDKEKIEGLKMEVLEKIPKKFRELRWIISTRHFSEDELKKLLRTAEQMRLTEGLKQDFENYKKQVVFGTFPTHP